MDYRIEKDGATITIWNDTDGIGLQFKEGESLQRYNSSIVLKDFSILETEEGVAHLSEVSKKLSEFAAQQYPKEFKPLKTDEGETL